MTAPERTPLDEVDFAVVDVETTGLDPQDRVIEVAGVRLRAWRETARFQTLVDPEQEIPPAATAVSGIDNAMISGAPTFARAAPELERLLAGAVFVAHNAPFDLHFLSRERKRCGLPAWKGTVIDTLRLARNAIERPDYSLARLRDSLALAPEPTHRALADVLTTAALLARLVELIRPRPQTLGELCRWQELRPLSWEEAAARAAAPALVRALQEAAGQRQAVMIEYAARSGPRSYEIVADRLERNGPLHYLQAVLAENGEQRTFRLDRIQRVGPPGAGDPADSNGRAADSASAEQSRCRRGNEQE